MEEFFDKFSPIVLNHDCSNIALLINFDSVVRFSQIAQRFDEHHLILALVHWSVLAVIFKCFVVQGSISDLFDDPFGHVVEHQDLCHLKVFFVSLK